MKEKTTWIDVYLNKYQWYRKLRKGKQYKHQFTKDVEELTFTEGDIWWARYGKINRYIPRKRIKKTVKQQIK